MAIELKMLLFTVGLFLVQLVMQVIAELLEHGFIYMIGNRDDWINPTGIGSRIERAYFNLLETMPAFAALVIVVLYTGNANDMTALGAQIYFWGRVIYVPAYVAGIPMIRTLVWAASMVGMLMIFWEMFKLVL